MRIAGASLLVTLLFTTACNDSFPVPPTLPPTQSKITVTATTNKPSFVLFRDGLGGTWSTLSAGGDGSYTGTATGPYTVVVGCAINAGTTQLTWEHDDVPNAKDSTTTSLTPPCDDVATHKVTGTATGAVAGDIISLGVGADQTVGAGGTFTFPAVPAGTYDVVVHNATTVRVGTAPLTVADVDIPAAAVSLSPAATLVAQVFTSDELVTDNQGDDTTPRFETGADQVLLAGKNSPNASVIFAADGGFNMDKTQSNPDIPSMVLGAAAVPSGFTQQVTYTGSVTDPLDATQHLTRTTNRNFTVGDSNKIILPSGYGSVVWYADPAGMSFIGDSPSPDLVTETLVGLNAAGKPAMNTVEFTAEYLSETSLTRLIVETAQTGFADGSRVDIKQPYTRSTHGMVRIDDKETDPPTHDNRDWTSAQQEGAP